VHVPGKPVGTIYTRLTSGQIRQLAAYSATAAAKCDRLSQRSVPCAVFLLCKNLFASQSGPGGSAAIT